MRLKELRIRNFANIRDIHLDFTKYDGRIIAISGPNGSGKTTLLEAAMPSTIFRTLPFYEARVQKHFSKTDTSEIESVYAVDIDNTERIVHCRIQGKYDETPKCFLTVDGSGLVAGPGVAEYDRQIAIIFPSEDIIMRSLYAKQGDATGFLSVDPMAAWQMFSDILGLDEIDTYIESSREAAGDESGKISELKSIIQDKEKHLLRLETGNGVLRPTISIENDLSQTESQIEALVATEPESNSVVIANTIRERAVIDGRMKTEEDHINSINQFLNSVWDFHVAEYERWRTKLTKFVAAKKTYLEWMNRIRGVDLDKDICRACPLTHGVRGALVSFDAAESEFLAEQSLVSDDIDISSLIFDLEYHRSIMRELLSEKKDLERAVIANSKQAPDRRLEWQTQYNELLCKKGQFLQELTHAKERATIQAEIAALRDRLNSALTKGRAAQSLHDICKEEKLVRIELVRPYIENVTNQILSNYQQGRFRISIDLTKALKTNKQRERLAFTTSVLDLKTGERRPRVSGGEGSVIAEAVRMALASLEMRTHKLGRSTAIRDEIAGFIDMQNVSAYFDILRNGLQFFDKILFVSHLPHITQQADVVIHLNHGNIVAIED